MDRGVAQLQGALNDLTGPGIYPDIFGFAVVSLHAAQRGESETSIALDLAHHGAKRVGVGFQQQTVIGILAAQIHQNATLGGQLCVITQSGKLVTNPVCGIPGETGRGVDGQKGSSLLPCVISVRFFKHIS